MYWKNFHFTLLRFIFISFIICLACDISMDDNKSVNSYNNDDFNKKQSKIYQMHDPFKALVHGDNTCFMARAYFPKHALADILPRRLSIPDDTTMKQYYPNTELKEDKHPFLIYFCHCSDIHDIISNIVFPEQEEMLFLIPVMYEHKNNVKYHCSYIPVLYLDSLQGVLGGLLYFLRKEFHPEMESQEVSETSGWWHINNIIEGTFKTIPGSSTIKLPQFFSQIFDNPYVTLSYPTPFPKYGFYKVELSQITTKLAEGSFYWNYKGTIIHEEDDTLMVYSEYHFTMSYPMKAKKFFGH